jgi:predicted nicotinamide N-methyase
MGPRGVDAVEAEREQFIVTQTVLAPVSLLPNILLYQATSLSPLWTESQEFLDRNELEPPYWAFAWPGGIALALYVLDHPETVRGKAVVDFGSGSGLVAIAAALAGAASVVAVDRDPLARTAIRLNGGRYGGVIRAAAEPPLVRPGDCMLGGDLFYEAEAARKFSEWFRALAESGATVLVGDPGRAYVPLDFRCVKELEVPTLPDLESRDRMVARVLTPP